MALLDRLSQGKAWTTVLIDEGPAAGAQRYRRGWAPHRLLENFDALAYLQSFPKYSVLYQWNGRAWQRANVPHL